MTGFGSMVYNNKLATEKSDIETMMVKLFRKCSFLKKDDFRTRVIKPSFRNKICDVCMILILNFD